MIKIIIENCNNLLNEYHQKDFPLYGKTNLRYIIKNNPYINNGNTFYEMHINVDPLYQGKGIASRVILDFANESVYPLYFGKARIINPNLIKVFHKMENDYPNNIEKQFIEGEFIGWLIKKSP